VDVNTKKLKYFSLVSIVLPFQMPNTKNCRFLGVEHWDVQQVFV
jgi:hypothetical protein